MKYQTKLVLKKVKTSDKCRLQSKLPTIGIEKSFEVCHFCHILRTKENFEVTMHLFFHHRSFFATKNHVFIVVQPQKFCDGTFNNKDLHKICLNL